MITYQPRDWVKVAFAWQGTVLPAVLGRVLGLLALTLILLLLREFVSDSEPVFRLFKPVGHTLIGVALGLLIVFRNNTSYDRFWEGRRLWGGLVNASRNLMRGLAVDLHDVQEFAGLVRAYPLALKQHLRSNKDLSEMEPLVTPAVYQRACAAGNPPMIIAYEISSRIVAARKAGIIDTVTEQGLENQVRLFLDAQGGCERILRTPIPFVFAVHIKQLILLYLLTLPLILIAEMGWAAFGPVAVIAFGLLGIEEAGLEIEDPFGDDPNDLPIEAMCATIGRDAEAIASLPR